MGPKGQALKVVLDTNVVVSALLYEGPTRRLVDLWKTGRIGPVATQTMLDEYARVLQYPKFGHAPEQVAGILQDGLLPWLGRVEEWKGRLSHPSRDPDDEVFLRAALGSRALNLISGDPHLLELQGHYPFRILTPRAFLAEWERSR